MNELSDLKATIERVRAIKRRSLTGLLTTSGGFAAVDHVVIAAHAIAESFSVDLLQLLVEREMADASLFVRMLYEDNGRKMLDTWPERTRWLSGAFGVDSGDVRDRLQPVIELRNAIVHGDGKLTSRQAPDAPRQRALERELQTLGVTMANARLTFSGDTARVCVSRCLDYVDATAESAIRSLQQGFPLP